MAQDWTPEEDDTDLREYIVVLLRRWWVVLVVFLLALGVTWLTMPKAAADTYEVRTRLILSPAVSKRFVAEGAGESELLVSSAISADILASLAKGDDLLSEVILKLKLQVQPSGESWPVERLADMINVSVDADGGGPGLSLITAVVRGGEPSQLKPIAVAWSEQFVLRNNALRATESVRSYDLILAQIQQTQLELNEAERERDLYLSENPLVVLKDVLAIKQTDLRDYLKSLLNTSAQLGLKTEGHRQASKRLNGLTLNGRWIGLDLNGAAPEAIPVESDEQRSALQAKNDLFQIQQQLQEFKGESGLNLLSQRLELKMELIGGYIRQLDEAEREYRADLATLEAYEIELELQPEFRVTFSAIDNAALWQQLGVDPGPDDWERVRELGLRTEQLNPVFTKLVSDVITTRASVESQKDATVFLREKLTETRSEILELELELTQLEDVSITRLLVESNISQQRYDRERNKFVELQGSVTDLQIDVQALGSLKDEYQALVDSYSEDVSALAIRIPKIEQRTQRLDAKIRPMQAAIDKLGEKLRESERAGDVQSNSVIIIESPVEPRSPIPVTNTQRARLPIGGALGLVLGVIAAFAVDFILRFAKTGNASISTETLRQP